MNKRNLILSHNSKERNEELEKIGSEIADLESKHIRNDILKKFRVFSQNPENINLSNMWKLLK